MTDTRQLYFEHEAGNHEKRPAFGCERCITMSKDKYHVQILDNISGKKVHAGWWHTLPVDGVLISCESGLWRTVKVSAPDNPNGYGLHTVWVNPA